MRTIHRLLALTLVLVAGVAAPREASAQSEGIKVHGDWVIDIREVDGRLISHHEFRNALTDEGKTMLQVLLTTPSPERVWAVALYGLCGQHACVLRSDQDNLAVSQGPNHTIVLSGHTRSTESGVVLRVSTHVMFCLSDCASGSFDMYKFTEKDTSSVAIEAAAGRLVEVKVTLSFS